MSYKQFSSQGIAIAFDDNRIGFIFLILGCICPPTANSFLKLLERSSERSLNVQIPGLTFYVINFELYCFNIN